MDEMHLEGPDPRNMPHRQGCGCECGRNRLPGQRRQCLYCGAWVSLGRAVISCWKHELGCCHLCAEGKPQEMDLEVLQMNFAKNLVFPRARASCAQPVMGRQLRVPDGLLSAPENNEMHNLLSEDVRAQGERSTRVRAVDAISAYEYENHMKRAALRKRAQHR